MIQNKQVSFSKEVDDFAVLAVSVVSDLKAGKPVGEVVAGAVSKVVDALAGMDQVGTELNENRKVTFQTIGYRIGELVDVILGPKSNVVQP
jgi:hypothetical protein